MSTRQELGALLALFALLALGGCTCTDDKQAGRAFGGAAPAWATDQLFEQAVDGVHQVHAGERTTVDANADLVVTFGGGKMSPEASAELAELQTVLAEAVAASAEHAKVVAEVETLLATPSEVRTTAQKDELATRSADLAAGARTVLAKMQRLGFAPTRIDAALDRAGQGPAEKGFAVLAVLLRERQGEMLREAQALAADAKKLEVAVQAFLDSPDKDRRQLHVDNYDTLPAGEYDPIERLGTDMTPAEQERFRRKLDETTALANALRSMQQAGLAANMKALRDEFRALLKNLPDDLASSWRQALAQAQLDPAVRTALATKLDGILAKVQLFRDAYAAWRDVVPPDGEVVDLARMLDRLRAAIAKTTTAVDALPPLRDELAALIGDPTLPQTLADVLKASGDAGIAAFVARVQTQAPALTGLARALGKALGWLLDNDKAIVPADVPPELWHLLEAAPEGRIELTRAGLVEGDSVLVKTFYRQEGSGRVERTHTYKVDAELIGWHRQISAELIFARADTGPGTATDWQPGVAAVADLHYRHRADAGWCAFWNFIDPALGVHLAMVDQTEETTEFGMGANLAFFDGFLSAGAGWNFSAESEDGIYWFVGIDLLDVLATSKNTFAGAK